MDSQQTPRASEDPNAGRGSSPMGKQNPALPPGFQARPQGPPPLSPRYPLNNGSVGGARLGGQQAPILHRLDSRSSLGSPTAQGGQFVQSRPPFGPPRPQNPQGIQIQGPRPVPTSNPQNVQGPPRYPPGTPGIRPPPTNFVGPRPPIYNSNQPQQIYYQPRNGDIRPQRPPNPEPGATSQIRFPPNPYNPDTRQPSPQVIPDTVVTPPPRNDWQLKDERVINQSRPSPVRESTNDKRTKPLLRQGQSREKMEVVDSRSSTPSAQIAEESRGLIIEENDKNVPKRKASPRGENEDDDDDVVMDSEKQIDSKSPIRDKITIDTLQPEVERVDSPSSPVSTASQNSIKKSGTPSPIPPAGIQDRPNSVNKFESSDQPPGDKLSTSASPIPPQDKLSTSASPIPPQDKLSTSASPIPPQDKSGVPSRSESRLGDSTNADLSIGDADVAESELNDTEIKEVPLLDKRSDSRASDVTSKDDSTLEKRSDSRASIRSSRSPIPSGTPDHPGKLSVPGSATPQTPNSPKSPKSPKSPQGSVKGFDNGQLRSLSPKSPTPSVSPASPNSPNSPAIPKSAEREKKTATFVEDSEVETQDTKQEDGDTEKNRPMTPANETRGRPPTPAKPLERAQTPGTPDGRKSSMKRSTSGRSIKSEAGSDSGADQTNQAPPTTNGVSVSPTKKIPPKSREAEKRSTAASPTKSPSKSVKSLPRTPEAGPPSTGDKKKVPMNKIQVGAAPSPNLKTVRSKIGSLDNASYKPGGGKVKIENRKLDFSKAQPKIAAKNDKYTPSGGDKKITQVKLQWNAKPKVGSLDNATYKPGGGDKKIETVKLDFKDKAKPKVGSKDNAKHVPGGGTVKSPATPPKTPLDQPNEIETQKIDIKAESKIGSMDNVKHKPGGGDKKIFNDRDYLRQSGSNVESLNGSGAQIKTSSVAERPSFIEMKSSPPEPNPPPTTPTRSRPSSAMSPVTPSALRTSLQAKTPDSPGPKRVTIAEESRTADDEAPTSARKSPEGQQTPRRARTPRSPGSSRPPSSLNLRASEKSPSTSRKTSPKGVHLPKLTSTPTLENSDQTAPIQEESKVKLPKLMQTSMLSSRLELAQ